jgi:ubiquinone/menaquinone biosynthesis C-methylase UbiE
MNKVEKFYDQSADQEWNRLERHRTEFAVTMKALVNHLPEAPADLLDIGGGPGRYAVELAKKGYRITLVDLSGVSLELAKEKASEANLKLHGVIKQDATDLDRVPDTSFDGVLLFGPLYHLLEESQRRQSILEAKRVLRPGGPFFATFITRFAPFRDSASRQPDWVVNEHNYAHEVLKTGKHTKGQEFPNAYFAHPDEIQPLMESCGFKTITVLGVEGIVAGHEEEIIKLQGRDWDIWVDLNYTLGLEPSLLGASDHILYVGRKST